MGETHDLLRKLVEAEDPAPEKSEKPKRDTDIPEIKNEQGTIAAFLEGKIHEVFTVTADKLFQNALMNRGDRIALSSAIGDALEAFRKAILEKCPAMTKAPMDPNIAFHLTLKEEVRGKEIRHRSDHA